MKKYTIMIVVISMLTLTLVTVSSFLQPSQLTITNNTTEHRAELLELFNSNWRWLFPLPNHPHFSPEVVDIFLTDQLKAYDSTIYGSMNFALLLDQKKLVGFVAYYLETPRVGRILFLAINSTHQGKGYAQMLLNYAQNHLSQHHICALHLGVFVDNARARHFYEKSGWSLLQQAGLIINLIRPIKSTMCVIV